MWVRGAAIRPVPAHAVVSREVLDAVETDLAENGLTTRSDLDEAFARYEKTQPALAERAALLLARPLDETALALGYFLTIAVWMSFERAFGGRLGEVTEDALDAADSAMTLEEELRASHSEEPLELEDVMAIEQPGILAFVNEHVDAALEPAPASRRHDEEPHDVDVEDVHAVYRAVLVMTLALSHAVTSLSGAAHAREILA